MELSREVHRVGYHFSTFVVDEACQTLGVTLNASGRVTKSHFASLRDEGLRNDQMKRQGKGKKTKSRVRKGSPKIDTSLSQAVIDTQAREAIEDLFPKIPQLDLHEIVSRAFDKVSKGIKTKNLVGTASGTSLVRRANLAVVAHIRHTYTNYDELLRSGMTWYDARRGVEKFTLDKLVSWRGDEDDENDVVMEDVLREVIVITDDEVDGSDAETEDRAKTTRLGDSNVEEIPLEALHTEAVDLTMTDDDDSADDDITMPYQRVTRLSNAHPYHQCREARIGEKRHIRWEEAINRHRSNPSQAHQPDARTITLQDQMFSARPLLPGQSGQYVTPQALRSGLGGRPAASPDSVYMPGTDTPKADYERGTGYHVPNQNFGQRLSETQQRPRLASNVMISNDQLSPIGNDQHPHLNRSCRRKSLRLVKAPTISGDADYGYPTYESRSNTFQQIPNIMPSVENDSQEQRQFASSQQHPLPPVKSRNLRLDAFSDIKTLQAHASDMGDDESLKRGVSSPSRQGIPHSHYIQPDGKIVLIPLDRLEDGVPLRSDVGGSFSESLSRASMPGSIQKLGRSPASQRKVTAGSEAPLSEHKLCLVPKNSRPRLSEAEQPPQISADRGQLPRVKDPDLSAGLPPQPRVSNVTRVSGDFDSRASLRYDQSAPMKQGMSYAHAVWSDKSAQADMGSRLRKMSLGDVRRGHCYSANDGRYRYELSGHRDEQTNPKQVIYLGAASTASAGPYGGRSRLNKQVEQPAAPQARQSGLRFASRPQQQLEDPKLNPISNEAPQRNTEARYFPSTQPRRLVNTNASTHRHLIPQDRQQQQDIGQRAMNIPYHWTTSKSYERPAKPEGGGHSHADRMQPNNVVMLD
ncbi:MAG: hypothetical protein Q9163_000421 [Psora crenata]